MWTTLSSRGESANASSTMNGMILAKATQIRLSLALLICLFFVGCSSETWAPDSPRAAEEPQASRAPSEDYSAYEGTIELVSVRVRRLDPTLEKMAGPEFMKRAREPVAVEVETAKALPKTPRNTSAVLFLNSHELQNTWMILPNKLVAFLPDRNRVLEVNTITAAWTGREDASRTRKALTLRREEIRP